MKKTRGIYAFAQTKQDSKLPEMEIFKTPKVTSLKGNVIMINLKKRKIYNSDFPGKAKDL
jgi:hypothetical protein